jgi:hypothetical protein
VATRADITLKPAAGLASEQARDARARAWAFVFECWKAKKAAHPGGPDDAMKGSSDDRAKTIIPE